MLLHLLHPIQQQYQLYHLFQPILHLPSFSCLGYEALLRSPYGDPETLFNTAMKNKQKYELDVLSIRYAIETFHPSLEVLEGLLFLNIFPSTLNRSFLFSQLCEWKYEYVPHKRIVLEINESERIQDLSIFRHIIHYLKELGYGIAMDDIGKGSSSLAALTMIEPDIIKLDKWFAEDLFRSKEKQNCLKRMVRFCGSDVQLILEGIETAETLDIAQSLGVCYGQGYLFGRPASLPLVKER
ncbi:EAL domain-containing protein [Ammoniphilus resinae]|uniref:EAL domain-containing protein (Putative c-di-GMP-specific phosphodiesterase class I) n=1 Tax=Ammoniphilus resinae TaxID=861532 RepID=A0ABS4GWG1_9BACL|nr:EAL domain-containing protein [Ammoniphilus resinae]MBP1934437.1 EAL domain-containing protein (putative c-di-GMP-specific phosphodiesterase class I) [Ammoniphilus resinae]